MPSTSTEWRERDLRDMVRRDRNHPSVILWSIGNEIPEQGRAGWLAKLAQRLTDIVHEEDRTRPTTAAFNNVDGRDPQQARRRGGHPRLQLQARRDYAQILKDASELDDYGLGDAPPASARAASTTCRIEKYEKHAVTADSPATT